MQAKESQRVLNQKSKEGCQVMRTTAAKGRSPSGQNPTGKVKSQGKKLPQVTRRDWGEQSCAPASQVPGSRSPRSTAECLGEQGFVQRLRNLSVNCPVVTTTTPSMSHPLVEPLVHNEQGFATTLLSRSAQSSRQTWPIRSERNFSPATTCWAT